MSMIDSACSINQSFMANINKWSIGICICVLVAYFSSFQSCRNHPYTQGQIMYENFCENCHMKDGSGLKGLIPPLANSDYLRDKSKEIACIIKYGQQGAIEVNGKEYDGIMPPNPQLSTVEITNIINYINNNWGNDIGETSVKSIKLHLEACEKPKPLAPGSSTN